MTWPWRRKKRPTDGTAARRDAQESLDDAVARWPEVIRVATSLRQLRRENGFREQIEYLFEGGHRQ